MALVDSNALLYQAFQPKFKFRYILTMDGVPAFLVKRVKKPQARNSETELSYLNKTRYFKGRTKYQPAQIVVVDAINPNMASSIQEWQLLHSDPVTGRDGSAALYQVSQISVQEIGSSGQLINKWTYHDCMLADVDFGENDSTDDTSTGEITFTIRYNYYTLEY